MITEKDLPHLNYLIQLRHQLHQQPELSGLEQETAHKIVEHLQAFQPDQILTHLGGTGVAAVYEGEDPEGPTVLFRAELDALPIPETGTKAYRSRRTGVAHLCGHDGHMAILVGLASLLEQQRVARGKVILLFQPAEETGAGARAVLAESGFAELAPDYVFALHNIPGAPLHQVVLRNEVFAAASTGLIVEFQGSSSHAAEPEIGHNPGVAMAELVLALNQLAQQKDQFRNLTLLTVIHARLGEVAFGTNPGFATVMATLRAYQPADFDLLKHLTEKAVKVEAEKHKLTYSIRYTEEFPATVNHTSSVQLVRRAAEKLQLEVQEAQQPFRWSEDFGHFTNKYNGALFGLGSGLEQPQLHHSNYDFPDALIPTGAVLFYTIAQQILNKEKEAIQ
ncbi:amidohydrolase [Pontibacter ruber]|uniref:Amidohydrolase n=1 Tax=Pontibacter ruber TaxID=1343895 RepID=A0ABW5CRW2_9BACT|nr:amidohydrolase [Pontibacter ruber]